MTSSVYRTYCIFYHYIELYWTVFVGCWKNESKHSIRPKHWTSLIFSNVFSFPSVHRSTPGVVVYKFYFSNYAYDSSEVHIDISRNNKNTTQCFHAKHVDNWMSLSKSSFIHLSSSFSFHQDLCQHSWLDKKTEINWIKQSFL